MASIEASSALQIKLCSFCDINLARCVLGPRCIVPRSYVGSTEITTQIDLKLENADDFVYVVIDFMYS